MVLSDFCIIIIILLLSILPIQWGLLMSLTKKINEANEELELLNNLIQKQGSVGYYFTIFVFMIPIGIIVFLLINLL